MPLTRQLPARRTEGVEAEEVAAQPAGGGGEELLDDTNELLDEIDSILEEQSVLTNYRQRSGQ
jgi:Pup-like protein